MKSFFGRQLSECYMSLRKFFIVMYWKNLTLKFRHYIQTLLEIIVPTLLYVAILATYLKAGAEFSPHPVNATTYTSLPTLLSVCSLSNSSNAEIVYYTNCLKTDDCSYIATNGSSLQVQKIMKQLNNVVLAVNKLCSFSNLTHPADLKFEPIKSEEALIALYKSYELETPKKYDLYGGIVFKNDLAKDSTTGEYPPLEYVIRFGKDFTNTETQFLFPQFQLSGPGNSGQNYEKFVKIQTMIDLAYIQLVSGKKLLPNETILPLPVWLTSTEEMPYPEHTSNNIAIFIGFLLPLFTVLSFCFVVPPILKRIVNEKETGVKELMRLMGLPNWMHWICWFFDAVTSASITVIIMIVLLCVDFDPDIGKVISYSNGFIIYLFFLLYASSLIVFLFALSTLFKSPNLALAAGIIIHLITFLVPFATIDDQSYASLGAAAKFALAVLPNVNLWWGVKVITQHEGRVVGIQWSNMFERFEPSDPMTMGAIWLMYLADIVIYSLITWYIDSVKPGKYGVAKKWYFIFQKSYWSCFFQIKPKDPVRKFDRVVSVDDQGGELHEPEPYGLEAGVVVKKLRKVFKSLRGNEVVAVNSVSFSAFHSQITALLGHNGAGKTTTMSVLTGLYSITSGYAEIDGHSIESNMEDARKSLGLCPQHNMLFTDLTVYEHFMIFAMIKGLSWKDSSVEAKRYMEALELQPKQKTSVSKLSGGMKRKVHLGVALIGRSKVVLLDEPTSGMDPEARRVIWDLLLKEKKNRTVILTTHFMEEADVLGDRIAIMSKGKVQCYGSPLFLKRQLGEGYILSITKGTSCNDQSLSNIIQQHVEGSSLRTSTNREMTYNLPMSQVKNFSSMFESLEHNKSKLDFLNLGISVTTMEDVFLRAGALSDNDEETVEEDVTLTQTSDEMELRRVNDYGSTQNGFESIDLDKTESQRDNESGDAKRLTGFQLWKHQMKGLLTKRLLYTKRRYLLFSITAVIPFLMAVVCQLMINKISSPADEFPARLLKLDDYEDTKTFFQSDFDDLELENAFQNELTGYVNMTTNLTQTILDLGKEDLADYRSQFIMAAEFSTVEFQVQPQLGPVVFNSAKAIYNTVPTHARPIAQNVVSNTLLKYLENDTSSTKHISVTNHPLPNNKVDLIISLFSNFLSPNTVFYGISLGTGITIFASVFLLFPLAERVTNAKQVQLMTGVHPLTFWFANILLDASMFIVSAGACVAILFILDGRNTFTTNGAPGGVILIMFLYSFCGIFMSYVFSFLARSPPAGFALIMISNIVVGAIGPVVVWSLASFGVSSDALILASRIVRYMLSIFPSFPMVRSLMAIAQIQEQNNQCSHYFDEDTLNNFCKFISEIPIGALNDLQESVKNIGKCCKEAFVKPEYAVCEKPEYNIPCLEVESFYSWDDLTGINIDLIWLTVDLIIFGAILFLIETGLLKKFMGKLLGSLSGNQKVRQTGELDSDVEEELKRVHERTNQDVLIVQNLIKDFGSLRAVNNLGFGVGRNECFGLLGINGAGKTTTFRLLTGDEILSIGNASLLGHNLMSNRSKFLSMIGYCPQFDSIIDVLTGREMLLLFARLRGIKDDQQEANKWLKALDIEKYADRQCGTYSGGNKRKLNVAMSLVGNPPILFMDEPTTGVDPAGRRKLWNIIKGIQKNGQAVVLTSHSMEECEALCDRLGIMVNGQFKCMGTTRHIKNKFGQGFTILVKLNTRGMSNEETKEIANKLKAYLDSKFEGCEVKDEQKEFIHFHVKNPRTSWSHLFVTMEGAKQLFTAEMVADYSVSETTLEEVFISFAKHQRPNDSS